MIQLLSLLLLITLSLYQSQGPSEVIKLQSSCFSFSILLKCFQLKKKWTMEWRVCNLTALAQHLVAVMYQRNLPITVEENSFSTNQSFAYFLESLRSEMAKTSNPDLTHSFFFICSNSKDKNHLKKLGFCKSFLDQLCMRFATEGDASGRIRTMMFATKTVVLS